jgi:hypothetical protein
MVQVANLTVLTWKNTKKATSKNHVGAKTRNPKRLKNNF